MKKFIMSVGLVLLIIITFALGYYRGNTKQPVVDEKELYGTYHLYNDKQENTQEFISLSNHEDEYFYRYFNDDSEQQTSEGDYKVQADHAYLITSGALVDKLLVVEDDYLLVIDDQLNVTKYKKTSNQYSQIE